MTTGQGSGRTFLVTGGAGGIGRQTVLNLAKAGGRVVVAARSQARAAPVVDEVTRAGGDVRALVLDLADFSSVRAAAAEVMAQEPRLDVLVNNAGLGGSMGLTRDGFELTWGTNHLGHFLFTLLLLPRLLGTPGARVVNVSSGAHRGPRRIPWDTLQRPATIFTFWQRYQVSKLSNILFTRELVRRHPSLLSFAVHPGVVASEIWRRIPQPFRAAATSTMVSIEEGAQTSTWCALAPEAAAFNGKYFARMKEAEPSAAAQDDALAAELWERSAAFCGL